MNYQSKNKTILEIEQVLKTQYPEGFGYKFLGKNANEYTRKGLSIQNFKAKIDLELPDSFYEFYEWLLKVEFPEKNVDKKTYLDYHQNQIFTLQNILDDTKMWQEIQAKNPKREWKSGFVALLSYDDAYQIVIDTKGEICGQKGALAYWDFKGGGCYYVNYTCFESFLKTKLELLNHDLYFPPSLDGDEDDEDSLTYDDYKYGEPADEIETIIEIVNGKQKIVNF
jgi:hypothetical protein